MTECFYIPLKLKNMKLAETTNNRRDFIRTSGLLGAGLLMPGINFAATTPISDGENIHQFGKREGYTNQISFLVSMMDWMRWVVLGSVEGLSQKDIDFLLDEKSNSVGAMLMHLAGTERYYQIKTLSGISKSDLSFGVSGAEWDAASSLGDKGRQMFKGKPLSYYLDKLAEVRGFSLKELKNREDNWLMESTKGFDGQLTNNYCKWFHVVEHESNHNGQIKFLKSRVS